MTEIFEGSEPTFAPLSTDYIRGIGDPLGTPLSGNILISSLDTLLGVSSGWIPSTATWSYSSADAPVFVAFVNANMTGILTVGMRVKLTQTTAKYFIIHAVGAYSGGNTLVTLYGGTDYTLANAAITSPYFSPVKIPFGFPASPSKWTVTATDTSSRTQASPTATTWYNLGSVSISVPIGCWKLGYTVSVYADRAAAGAVDEFTTLSTANNSESNASLTNVFYATEVKGLQNQSVKYDIIAVAAKTAYYLNTKTNQSSITSIYNTNNSSALVITAVDAYL
jgi:hypothetical protein